MCAHKKSIRSRDKSQYSMFDSDTQGFYKSEQQESSIMRRSFNPHALQRRAHLLHVGAVYHHEFQSTRPVWGATARAVSLFCHSMFQSTRPVWGATRNEGHQAHVRCVSIHAPRVGRDGCADAGLSAAKVSIHAPRVGRDGNWSHDFPLLPRIYGHSPPQIRFSRHLRPTPLLRHDSRTYIFTFCFLFTSPSHSVMNAHMMIAASKS